MKRQAFQYYNWILLISSILWIINIILDLVCSIPIARYLVYLFGTLFSVTYIIGLITGIDD